MSEELRAWMKGVEKRRDRALTAFGDDHAFADAVLDCVNADMSDLIAKVEELAEACDWFLHEIQTNGWADGAEILRRFQSALRAPGGGSE